MGNVKVFYTNSVNNTKVEKTIQTTERNVQQGNSNMTRTKPDFVQGVGHCNITRIEKTKVWFIGTILASLALGYGAVRSAYASEFYQGNQPVVVQNGNLESDVLGVE